MFVVDETNSSRSKSITSQERDDDLNFHANVSFCQFENKTWRCRISEHLELKWSIRRTD